jgi:hypothetical protein
VTNLPFNLEAREQAKMLPDKRRFILRAKEGEAHKTDSGAVDKRLFTGDVNLYAIRDTIKGTWFLRYDKGALPSGLDQQFTEFTKLVDFVTGYFARRNVEVST